MNTKIELIQIAKLIKKAQQQLETLIESEPKPTPGKPPQPYGNQKVELAIWRAWDQLKDLDKFDAYKAKKVATGIVPRNRRIDSSYSSILSRWAQLGYIDRIEAGSGPKPAFYKIQSNSGQVLPESGQEPQM